MSINSRYVTGRVTLPVLLESVALDEALLADVALVRPLAAVRALVHRQRAAVCESLIAALARVRPVTCEKTYQLAGRKFAD